MRKSMMFTGILIGLIVSLVISACNNPASSNHESNSNSEIVNISGWWNISAPGSNSNFFGYLKIVQSDTNIEFRLVMGDLLAWGTISGNVISLTAPGPDGFTTIEAIYTQNGTIEGYGPYGPEKFIMVRAQAKPTFNSINSQSITIDGNFQEWQQSSLIISDPQGDADGDSFTDIEKVYMCKYNDTLFFRIDLVGDVTFGDDSNNFRYQLIIQTSEEVLFEDFVISVWRQDNVRLKNRMTDTNIALSPAGVLGNQMEFSVPLSLLGQLTEIGIFACTYFWVNDQNKGDYDYTEGILLDLSK